MGFFSDVWDSVKDTASDLWDDLKEGDILGAFENSLKLMTGGTYDLIKVGLESLVDVPEAPEVTYQDRKQTVRGAANARQIIYGQVRTGGQVIHITSSGNDKEYLHMVVVWATHQVEEIGEIYFGDEQIVDENGVVDAKWDGQSEKLLMVHRLGDHTTADSTMVSEIPGWTTDHKVMGCAHSYFRLGYDRDFFPNGIPNITAVIKGKNDIFDPRDSSTGYTANHALCVRDYLTWSDYGMGVSASSLNDQSFIDGANIADQTVVREETGLFTEPRYEVNGTLLVSVPPLENLQSMVRAGAAFMSYSQGFWTYLPGEYAAPDAEDDYNEDDLIGGISFTTGPGRGDRINTVRGTYVSKDHNYEPIDIVPLSVPAYVTEDLEELERNIEFPFTNTGSAARRLGKIIMERSRYGIHAQVTFKAKALRLVTGKRLTFSSPKLGWVNKVFRVTSVDFDIHQGIKVNMQEDAPEIYNWAAGDALIPIIEPAPALPSPFTVYNPTNLNVAQEEYVSEVLSRVRTRLTLTFDQGSTASDRYDIQFRETSGAWRYVATNWQDTTFVQEDLGLGQYEFRIQAINELGIRAQTWVTSTAVNVVNLTNGNLDTIAPLFAISNLALEGGGVTFDSKDAKFTWNHDNATLDHFLYYHAEILDSGGAIVLRSEELTDNSFVYTHEKNTEDGAGRSFQFRIRAVSRNLNDLGANHTSPAVVLAVSNPGPALPQGLSLVPGFNIVNISFVKPTELDFTDISIWMSETQGFTPGPSNLVATTSASPITIAALDSNTTYYFRLAVNDTFGQGVTSSELSATTLEATVPGLGPWATVGSADLAFINANMDNDAVASDKIVNLTASKIVTGTLAATQVISCLGIVEAVTGSYRAAIGPVALSNGKTALMSFALNNNPLFAVYEDGSALFTGALNIQAGTTGYNAITDKPTTLGAINGTEGTKLAGIADGATVGATWGSNIGGQPSDSALLNTNQLWSQVGGAGKPADNATVGATWGTDVSNIPSEIAGSVSAAGLYITPTYMGFYNGSSWASSTYIQSNGHFQFGGGSGNQISWDGSTLSVEGAVVAKSLATNTAGSRRVDISDISNTISVWWDDGHASGLRELINMGKLNTDPGYAAALKVGDFDYTGKCFQANNSSTTSYTTTLGNSQGGGALYLSNTGGADPREAVQIYSDAGGLLSYGNTYGVKGVGETQSYSVGVVGDAGTGISFYADGNRSLYGNFSGAIDVLIPKTSVSTGTTDLGKIVMSTGVIATSGTGNVTSQAVLGDLTNYGSASTTYNPAIGVIADVTGLDWDYADRPDSLQSLTSGEYSSYDSTHYLARVVTHGICRVLIGTNSTDPSIGVNLSPNGDSQLGTGKEAGTEKPARWVGKFLEDKVIGASQELVWCIVHFS